MTRLVLLILIILAAAWFLTPKNIAGRVMHEGIHEAFRQIFRPYHR